MSVILQILLSMIIFMDLCSATPAAVEPPTIIKGPSMPTMHLSSQPNANIVLPCTATGTRPLEYEWLRDGRHIDNENTDKLNVAYDSTKSAVDGYYQCRVRNSLGVALSNVTRIITARQAVFDKAEKRLCPAVIGKPLRVECKWANMGVPTPDRANFSWSGITTSKRVQIDDTGNLYMSAVIQKDIGVDRSCQIRNSITNVIATGSEVQITQDQSTEPVAPQKPKISFCSNYSDNAHSVNTEGETTIIAIEGQSASLHCFFGGSENVQIEWRRYNVKPPVERMSTRNADSELFISHVLSTDAGEFECIGINTAGQTSFKTIVHVYAIPEFKTIAAQPHNVNKSVGDDLTFNCTAYSRPTASVQWFINGDKLSDFESSRPNKFRLSANGSSLTVGNLCKNNCTGGHNDIMVVQCNASNAFGSAFSNGYINVFERTVFTVKPVDVNDVVFPDAVSFYAHAESDISTPVIYKWYREGHLLANDNDKYLIDDSGNLTITKTDASDVGEYRCVATNGISQVEETVNFGTIVIASTLPWIVLMILLILLFLFAIILCICCMIYQNRGEDYLVDETERKCGNDPDKDLADAELQPFSRQDNLSTHSLGRSDTGSTHSLVNEGCETVRRPSNFGTLQ